MTKNTPESDSLIEYPCRFPIKVMGAKHPDFVEAIVAVAQEFEPEFDAATVSINTSKGGNYLGLTLAVWVTHREQLDNLYRALTGHPMVKVVL
jgi:putative lipoic acid-binding regulatory protein